jgi:hypothetical protein
MRWPSLFRTRGTGRTCCEGRSRIADKGQSYPRLLLQAALSPKPERRQSRQQEHGRPARHPHVAHRSVLGPVGVHPVRAGDREPPAPPSPAVRRGQGRPSEPGQKSSAHDACSAPTGCARASRRSIAPAARTPSTPRSSATRAGLPPSKVAATGPRERYRGGVARRRVYGAAPCHGPQTHRRATRCRCHFDRGWRRAPQAMRVAARRTHDWRLYR